MPCRSRVDLLAAALAAAEASGDLRHVPVFGQGVDAHVGLVLQASHVAVTMRTPFWRMLARVIGGPGWERMSGVLFRSSGGSLGGALFRGALGGALFRRSKAVRVT